MCADGDVFYRRLPARDGLCGCLHRRGAAVMAADGSEVIVMALGSLFGTIGAYLVLIIAAGHLCSMHFGKISGVFL